MAVAGSIPTTGAYALFGVESTINRFGWESGECVKAAACPGAKMGTPLGCYEALPYPCVGIAEGSPNSLAIIAHAYASGVEELVAPICMPSASANFTPAALGYLQGKRARIFIDDDKAGQEASTAMGGTAKKSGYYR